MVLSCISTEGYACLFPSQSRPGLPNGLVVGGGVGCIQALFTLLFSASALKLPGLVSTDSRPVSASCIGRCRSDKAVH